MSFPFFLTWCDQNTDQFFHLKSAHGNILITEDEKEIIDLSSISFQATFGIGDKLIADKIKKQVDGISVAFPKAITSKRIRVTKRLLDFIGIPGKIFYTTSGTESVENALKLARLLKKRNIILSRKISYHGATLGSLSITGDWRNDEHTTVDDWTKHIPEPSVDPEGIKTRAFIEKIGPENIAGFCLESITGGNGVYIPPKSWWKAIKNLCHDYDLFLIIDEVACGFYRTGKPFGFNHFDITPDMICMAKGISGGMLPFGALWTSENIANNFNGRVLSLGLTGYAHPLGLAALDGVLDHLENPALLKNVEKLSEILKEKLAAWEDANLIKAKRCIGLLAAVELKESATWKYFFDRGVHVYVGKEKILLAPNLNLTPDALNTGLDKLENILRSQN